MMILFNLDTLESVSKGDAQTLRLVLKHFYFNSPSKSRLHYTRYNRARMFGKSFLLNPEPLVTDDRTDPLFIAQYIRLAGRRSYMLYKTYGITHLSLSNYPDIDISMLKHNPLLKIADNNIYFKYEIKQNGNFIQ